MPKAKNASKRARKSGRTRKSAIAKTRELVPPTRATGEETATGAALAQHEIPQGEDRGSKVEIVGGTPTPDDGSPKGLQAQPAQFTSNGSLPPNKVPTSSGLVPVSAVASTPEDAKKRIDARRDQIAQENEERNSLRHLSDADLAKLGGAEIRAIAHQRGYELPAAGTRTARAAFSAAQAKDSRIKKAKK